MIFDLHPKNLKSIKNIQSFLTNIFVDLNLFILFIIIIISNNNNNIVEYLRRVKCTQVSSLPRDISK